MWKQKLQHFANSGHPKHTAHRLYKSVVTIHATDIDSPTFRDPEADADSGEDTDNEKRQASVLLRQGRAAGSSNDGDESRSGKDDVRGGPATGGMQELAKDWVVVKKNGRPIQFFGAKCLEGSKGGKHDRALPFARNHVVHVWQSFRR